MLGQIHINRFLWGHGSQRGESGACACVLRKNFHFQTNGHFIIEFLVTCQPFYPKNSQSSYPSPLLTIHFRMVDQSLMLVTENSIKGETSSSATRTGVVDNHDIALFSNVMYISGLACPLPRGRVIPQHHPQLQ